MGSKWHFVTQWKPPASQADSRLNLEVPDWDETQTPGSSQLLQRSPRPRQEPRPGEPAVQAGPGRPSPRGPEKQAHSNLTPSLPSTSKVTSG